MMDKYPSSGFVVYAFPMRYLIFLSVYYICHDLQAQSVLYIDPMAINGNNNGSSWADAFRSLHDGLAAAQKGDAVWVAKGVYYPDNGADRSKSFHLKSGVKMFGGFAGTETNLQQRNINLNTVVLSGDVGTIGDSTDNSYSILTLTYPDSNTIIDGFTLRGGFASSDTFYNTLSPLSSGGAVYIIADDSIAEPQFINCIFRNNFARANGGAIYVRNYNSKKCALSLQGCRFLNNKSDLYGGALYWANNHDHLSTNINNCVFQNNRTKFFGGAMYFSFNGSNNYWNLNGTKFVNNKGGSLPGACSFATNISGSQMIMKVIGCEFKNNSNVQPNDVGEYFYYENFQETGNKSFIEFSDNVFENNRGLVSIVEPFANNDKDSCLLMNNIFRNNQGGFGGGYPSGFCQYEGNYFFNNFTAFTILSKQHIIRNNWFENTRRPFGERLWINANDAYANVLNCIFLEENSAQLPLGLSDYYVLPHKIVGGNKKTINISNCLFFDLKFNSSTAANSNNPDIVYSISNGIFANNRNQNGESGIPLPNLYDTLLLQNSIIDIECGQLPPNQMCGSGNIYATDAMFVDTANKDFRLLPCSPGIDAGDTAIVRQLGLLRDFLGRERITDGRVDIGPYELPSMTLLNSPQVKGACEAVAGGSIEFELTNACLPLAVEWTSNLGNGNGNTDLLPGEYVFTVTDSKNRPFVDTVSIPTLPPPDLVPHVEPLVCGDTLGGSATVSATGGQAPFSFFWADQVFDSLRQNLAPGTYGLTVTDARQCKATAVLEVARTGSLDVDFQVQEPRCFRSGDGSITAMPLNGKSPFAYNWAGGSTQNPRDSLTAGVYGLTITDAWGCDAKWTLPLLEPNPLSWTVAQTTASASTASDGALAVDTAFGGTMPYGFAWSNGPTGELNTGLFPGTYFLTLTDAHGCVGIDTFIVDFTMSAIGAYEKKAAFDVWPNPASDFVNINFSAACESCALAVFDQKGLPFKKSRLVPQLQKLVLDLSDWPPGAYFFVLTDQNGNPLSNSKKIVVHHRP